MDLPTASFPPGAQPAPERPPPEGWAVGSGRGVDWWTGGWKIFTASPVIWIAITVIFGGIMLVLALIPILGHIATSLLYPILCGGVLAGSRAVDRGETLGIEHLFSCFKNKAIPLVIVALLYFAGWFLIWAVAIALLLWIVGFGTLSAIFAGDPGEAAIAMLSTLGIGSLVILLLAALLGVPLLMAYWFAPALVLFRGDEPMRAMRASFSACMRNMPPFLVYGLVGIVAAFVASIPLGLGWVVLMPVYGASIYVSYKDIFGEPA